MPHSAPVPWLVGRHIGNNIPYPEAPAGQPARPVARGAAGLPLPIPYPVPLENVTFRHMSSRHHKPPGPIDREQNSGRDGAENRGRQSS